MQKISFFIYTCITSLAFSVFGNAQDLQTEFQHILDSVYAKHDSTVGILIHIEAPDLSISWSAAAGRNNKQTSDKLHVNQPVLIASNTKTYVSAAILKLVEKKEIRLDQPIEQLIHKNSRYLLGLDGYDLKAITVRHLLSHTSGIADYVNDAYFDFVDTHPNYKWKRSEQIQRAIVVGDPLYSPGMGYKYADVNFLLLTEIIEQKTDLPFYTAIRELLEFEKHGLRTTWFKDLESLGSTTEPLAHQYWDKLNWDSYELNHSWDLYGGGGLASTVTDLGRFFDLLFHGKIISDESLIKEMRTFVLPMEESRYCLGLMNISFNGKEAYYHGGFWGTNVMYIPELNLTVAAITLERGQKQVNPEISRILVEAVEAHLSK